MRRPQAPRPAAPGSPEEPLADAGEDGWTRGERDGRGLVDVLDEDQDEDEDEDLDRGEGAGGQSGAGSGALAAFGRGPVETARSRRRDRVVSSGLTDRLAERRRTRRRLGARRVAGVLAGLLVVVALVWAIAFSPLLALRTQDVAITGSDGTVQVGEVQDVLAHHAGTSLARLDPAALGDEVEAGLIRVRSAQVTRTWPHGLSVAVTVRVPVATRQVDGGWEVLDGDAVVLETDATAPEGLVTITAPAGEELTASQVSAVAQAVGSLDADTRRQVAQGSASATGQVTLVLATGASVVWGDASEPALKAEVLAVLLDQGASVYDVSSPHSPTTR